MIPCRHYRPESWCRLGRDPITECRCERYESDPHPLGITPSGVLFVGAIVLIGAIIGSI
jgi:hypothetical protein